MTKNQDGHDFNSKMRVPLEVDLREREREREPLIHPT